VACTQKGD